MKEAKSEAKQDTGAETPGEDLLDQIMAAHLAKMDEVMAKVPVGTTVGPEDIAKLRDELKAYMASTLSVLAGTMATSLTYSALPAVTAAVTKVTDGIGTAYEQRLQTMLDDGMSRMQALNARTIDLIDEDRKQDAAQRKEMNAALQALMRPRKKTGVVTLPSGKVEMVVTETVQ